MDKGLSEFRVELKYMAGMNRSIKASKLEKAAWIWKEYFHLNFFKILKYKFSFFSVI